MGDPYCQFRPKVKSLLPKLTPSLRTNAFNPSPMNTSVRTENAISVATTIAGRPNRREGIISTRKEILKRTKMLEASKTKLMAVSKTKIASMYVQK